MPIYRAPPPNAKRLPEDTQKKEPKTESEELYGGGGRHPWVVGSLVLGSFRAVETLVDRLKVNLSGTVAIYAGMASAQDGTIKDPEGRTVHTYADEGAQLDAFFG